MVKKRKDGRYYVRADLRTPNGKIVTKQITAWFESKKAANEKHDELLDELRKRVKSSLKAPEEFRTFGACLQEYKREHPDSQWPEWLYADLQNMLGNVALDRNFDATFGRQWQLYKQTATINGTMPSRSKTNKFLSLARAALSHCRKFRHVTEPYLEMFSKQKEEGRGRYIRHIEFLKICNNLATWAIPITWCAYVMGARMSEMRNLLKADVDLFHRVVPFTSRKGRDREKKTRYVPIHKEMFPYFRDTISANPDCPYAFNINGRQILKDSLTHAFLDAARSANVTDVHFHDLRGTCATNMELRGVRRSVIKQLIGHTTDTMFYRYQKITGEAELEEAINGVQEPQETRLQQCLQQSWGG